MSEETEAVPLVVEQPYGFAIRQLFAAAFARIPFRGMRKHPYKRTYRVNEADPFTPNKKGFRYEKGEYVPRRAT